MLAFDGAGFAVDAVDDSGVSVDVDGHAFVEEVVGFLVGRADPLHVFGFVHDRTVVIGVEGVVDAVGDFVDLLIGFGLIPGAFELADLDFVGADGFFLRERRRGAEEKCERQEEETVHSEATFVGVLEDVSKEWGEGVA